MFNIKDIGGYPMSGGVTKWKNFVRSEGIECAKNTKQIFRYIAERLEYSGILYNCVSELDALADYMVSSVYLKPFAENSAYPINQFHQNPNI